MNGIGRLQISQAYGQIGINTTPSSLEIKTGNASLDIHQEHGKIEINSIPASLEISQYECFAAMGYENFLDAAVSSAQMGRQQVMEYIAKTVSDGDRLMHIEKGGNPIKEIAVRDAWPVKQREGSFKPNIAPDIRVEQGSLEIIPPEVQHGEHIGYSAEYIAGDVDIRYTPGKVNIYMKKWPSVTIDVRL